MSSDRNPYEVLAKKFADRRAHVVIYEAVRKGGAPNFVGVWRGENPNRDVESIGPLIRQGLAGFTLSATWRDLTAQLENSGFQYAKSAVLDVLRDAADVVRIIFWDDGLISCQWLTHGPANKPDESMRAIGVLPSRSPREGN